MKIKAILFALALTGASAFAQGLVTFQNSVVGGTPIQHDLNGDGISEGNIAGGGDYSFYFIYGTSAVTLSQTSATFLSGSPGRITTTGTGNIALNGIAGGTPTFFQLFAYRTSAGSYAAAESGGLPVYTSGIITLTPSTGPSPGTPMFGTTPGTSFQGFTLAPVPEPSTIALGLIGAGSLLFLRRKK